MSTSSAPRRRSITETHARIAQLGWEPDYHQPAIRYPTRYRFPHKAKDPMKHIMREYLPMELEKDERVYGGFDAAVRADMPSKAHERWLEILKPFITITNFAEIGAGRCMSMLMSAVPNNELRNGYHVQSDEARHISNGYATLLTVLQDDHNAPLIEQDLQQAFWINHAFIDIFAAVVLEYFSRDRSDPESYLDKWDRWVRDDWHRAYVMKLGKLGLDIPTDIFERARERLVAGVHHRHAILAFAAWPLAHWRFDPLDERDFEWFEDKYPGWYAQYGAFWEGYRQGTDPAAGFLPLRFMNMAPPFCWTCQGLCVSEADRRHRIVPGPAANGTPDPRTRFYCSRECEWMDESNPGRYTGDRNY